MMFSASPSSSPHATPSADTVPIPTLALTRTRSNRACLDRAFAALRRQGLVVRRNFRCCVTCACAEIWHELEGLAPADRPRGYVYYHQQDTRRAAQGEGLYVRYLGTGGTDESMCAVGRAVVEALRDVGLQPEWDGDPRNCVYVPLNWKRSRG